MVDISICLACVAMILTPFIAVVPVVRTVFGDF